MDVAYAYTSKRFLVAYNQIGPPTADIVAQMVDNGGNLVGGPQALSLRQPLAARAERRLRHPQRRLHGGVGRVLQPGRARRRARAHGRRPRPARSVRCVKSPRAPPSTCRRSNTTTARGQFFVAWYTQPSIWGRTVAPDGTPVGGTVARRLQLRDLRRPRPVLQPGREHLLRRLPRARLRGRRRPGVGGRRARPRDHVTATPGDHRQLQPAHHVAHRPPRMARRHLVELRSDHRAARAFGWRRAAAARRRPRRRRHRRPRLRRPPSS